MTGNHSLSSPANMRGSIDVVSSLRDATTAAQIQKMETSANVADSGHSARRQHSHWIQSMLFLMVCGVLPWQAPRCQTKPLWQRPSAWYQWLVLGIPVLAFAGFTRHLLTQDDYMCYSEACVRLGLVSDLPLALGGFLGLISLSTYHNTKDFIACCELLHSYACREEFDSRWAIRTHWDLVTTLLVWCVVVFERVRGSGVAQAVANHEADAWIILHTIMFTLSSLILVCLTFCMIYICQALVSIIDSFCIAIVVDGTLDEAVPRWNTVQAILRKGSKNIQLCLFVLQATVLFTVLLGAVDVYQSMQQGKGYVSALLPGALLIVGMSRIFVKAASVTDKCARVPSLINSCTFDDDIDLERQYVVEYVIYSAAGFYVFEICLTSQMTLYFFYILVVGVFTLFTQIATEM